MNRPDFIANWFLQKQALLTKLHVLPRLPPIELSDMDPPAFKSKRLKKLYYDGAQTTDETSDIMIELESWLGRYDLRRKRVTLWRKGIELCSRMMGCSYSALFDVVLVHELGHWFHAEAITENGSTWTQEKLKSATREYDEAWAQWFAWIYVNETSKELVSVFSHLQKRQPEPYSAWKVFGEECSISHQAQVLSCLARLRSCNLTLNLQLLKIRDMREETWRRFAGICMNL